MTDVDVNLNLRNRIYTVSFFDQREGYNVIFIPCPSCGSTTGVKEKIIRYE